MTHLVLIGDSVLDNGAYTSGGPSVIDQVRDRLPTGWEAALLACDGSTTEDIQEQLDRVPSGTTHLFLSVGGNNALLRSDLLDTPVTSSGEALLLLHEAAMEFEASYKKMLAACQKLELPIVVCTIYHGNFPEKDYRDRISAALATFNDAIIRIAAANQLKVVDLRAICNSPEDYANPIEPSSRGGDKIADAIVNAVTESRIQWRGGLITAG